MTDETKLEDQFQDPAPLVQDELSTLKARADQLGVTYHPSIGAASLKAKLEAFLEGNKAPADVQDEVVADKNVTAKSAVPENILAIENDDDTVTYSPKETDQQKRVRLRKEAAKLIRVKITCMNPNKKDWPGEIISVGNATVGTHKKFVPFNTGDEGYHIPNMLYQYLKTRECTTYRQGAKGLGGVQKRELVMIREFAIEVLPDLDEQALQELAQRQAMAGGTSAALEG